MAKNKDNATPHYEMLYIVSNQYTEEEVKPIAENTNKTIEKYGGQTTYSEVWGKKKFCYPINNEHHGYYFLVEFDMASDKIKGFNNEIGLNNEILRHMIVAKKIKSLAEIEAEKRAEEKRIQEKLKKAEEKEKEEEQEDKKAKTKKPINLKDLDEKLDKILDTDDLL